MSLRITCPHCERTYVLDEELRGKKVRCKGCQKPFTIRAAIPPDADEPNDTDRMRKETRERAASRPANPTSSADEENLARRRRVRRSKTARLSPFWLVGGTMISVVLLVVVAAGLLWVLKGKKAPPTESADGPPSAEAAQDGSKLLEEALAELDRTEPGWRMADLQRKRAVIPDQNNSALHVLAAKKLLPADWPQWPVAGSERDADRVARLRQEFEAGLNNHPPTAELTAAQVAALRAELRRASAALAEARKLVDLPAGRFPIDWSEDPDEVMKKLPYQDARVITRLLEYDTLLRAQERDLDSALASCRAAVNAGRSISDDPTMIAGLVRIACGVATLYRIERVLNQGEASEAALATLQALLEDEAEQPFLRNSMPGERAYQDWYMQTVQEGRKRQEPAYEVDLFGFGEAAIAEARKDLLPGSIKRTRAVLLRLNTQCVAISRLPVEEQRPRIEAMAKTLARLPKAVQLNWVSFEKTALACCRSQADMRCAAVTVALERYRQKHQRWPTELSELTPAFLPRVPLDALDGKPLRYRQLTDGVMVYSVGLDGKDDGGRLDRDATKPGTDRGFRLWDVPQRRQPPR